MNLIELHILQSFPVSCLNRDDVGAPKTAIFGGVNRARISSQCLKRAIRLQMHELCPDLCKGERSRLIVDPLSDDIQKALAEKPEIASALGDKLGNASSQLAREFADRLAKFDADTEEKKGLRMVKTLMFLSPGERRNAAAAIADALGEAISSGKEAAPLIGWLTDSGSAEKAESKKKSNHQKLLDSILKKAFGALREKRPADAADIALFGRMVASDPSLNIEGAAMFSHALSTHRADNDIDFFTAVDDRQQDDPTIAEEDRAGSGMMGSLEFTSAVYYRYAAVNLTLLQDEAHLGEMSPENQRKVLDAFLRSAILAVPGARRNSMNANTLPAFVLGVYRENGHPIQLVNAFENPVRAGRAGLVEPSIQALENHFASLKKTWGLQIREEVRLPGEGMTLDRFCERLLSHV